MVLSMDIAPLSGLYPFLSSGDIVVRVEECVGGRFLTRRLSPSASIDAQSAFDEEVRLWLALSNRGVLPRVRASSGVIAHLFEGVQLSTVSRYYLRKNAREIIQGIAARVSALEDYGVVPGYFTLASFAAPCIQGSGELLIIDLSTANVEEPDVQGALLSLAYCLLELCTGLSRSELPGELSCQKLKVLRRVLPPGIYEYLKRIVEGQSFLTVRDAYHALTRITWSAPPPPLWEDFFLCRFFVMPIFLGLCLAALSASFWEVALLCLFLAWRFRGKV